MYGASEDFPPSSLPPPFRLQEKHTREKLRDHLKNMVGTQEELKEVQKKVSEVVSRIKLAHQRKERLLHPGAR